MKKKILTLALAAIAAIGFTASAQAPQNKMYTPQTFTDYAFEGVLLELPQQQRIDSLHAAIRTSKMQKVHAMAMCPDSVKEKHECQHDKQEKRGMRPGGNAGAGVMPGVAYVAKVKEILTPEQFDTFMSNIASMPENVVNNLAPEMPQFKQHANMSPKEHKKAGKQQCNSGKCAEQNCNSGKCAEQNCNSGNCAEQNCKSGNCAEQNCNSGKCAEQQCKSGDCKKQDCKNAAGNCTKSNCKADKHQNGKKAPLKQKKSK